MAAGGDTLHTLLIRLGFDVTGLERGKTAARSALEQLQASAGKTATSFVPATTALQNMIAAANGVAGTRGAPNALNAIAKAAKDLDAALSPVKLSEAQTAMSTYARTMAEVSSQTGVTGSGLSAVAAAAVRVANATRGSTTELKAFLAEARQVAQAKPSDLGGFSEQRVQQIEQQMAAQIAAQKAAEAAAKQAAAAQAKAARDAANALSPFSAVVQRLGFDANQLARGLITPRASLDALTASASKTALSFMPATRALEAFNAAASSVQGTRGGPNALNAMAAAAKNLDGAMKGLSRNDASKLMTSFATSLEQLAAISGVTGDDLAMVASSIARVGQIAGATAQSVRQFMVEVRQAAQANPAGVGQFAQQRVATLEAAEAARVAGIEFQKTVRAANALGTALGTVVPGGATRAAAGLNQVSAAAEQAASRASFMQRTLSMAFAFSGGVAVTNVIAFAGNALLGFNSRLEQAHLAFTQLIGDADGADAFIAKMEAFANVTPFEFKGLTEDVQKLIAMGFAAEDALPTLRAIGDAVAGLGGSQEKLDRIAIAMGQISTAGRVNSQDMRQLTEAGIPAWKILADSIHKTVGETRDLAEKGLIPANTALAALIEGMESRFGGMMQKQARTAQGAFSTIRDMALQTISGAVEPLFKALSAGMVGIADFMVNGGGRYIAPVIWAIGTALTVALIPKLYGAAIAASTASVAFGTTTVMIDGVATAVARLSVPIFPLILAISMLGLAWQENFLGIRTTVGPVIDALVDGLTSISGSLSFLTPVIEALAVIISTRLVISLIASAAAMIFSAVSAGILGTALSGLTIESGAAAVATGGLAASTGILGTVMGGITGILSGIVALLGGALVASIALAVAAIVLLVTNFDQVTNGLRVIYYGFLQVEKGVIDFASSLPIVGDAFSGWKDHVSSEMADLEKEMSATAQKIADAQKAASEQNGEASGASMFEEMDKEMQAFLERLKNGSNEAAGASQSLLERFGASIEGIKEAARSGGVEAMDQMAQGIASAQNAPLEAMANLRDMFATSMTPQVEIARLMGMMSSQEMAAGLNSGDAAIVAATEAWKLHIEQRLDQITEGAYSRGHDAAAAYAQALEEINSNQLLWEMLGPQGAIDEAKKRSQAILDEWNKWAPSAEEAAKGLEQVNDELAKANTNTQALSALKSAFSEIRSAAEAFFSEQHQHNLQLIEDARNQKNAILDAKAALNQAPVTAAQKALDAQRSQIQEWRLRQAVATASSPEQQRDAILALQDFLAQQHIDQMQAEVDNAKDVIDTQKRKNDDLAAAQKAAEDQRYEAQRRDFERQLELLQRYLEKHPGEWQKTQEKIIALLKGFGFSYGAAGKLLGSSFTDKLREQLKAAETAAKDAAAAVATALSAMPWQDPKTGVWHYPDGSRVAGGSYADINPYENLGSTGSGSGDRDGANNPGGWTPMATGSWTILKDNLRALLHKDEMVAPADVASLLRAIGEGPVGTSAWSTLAAGPSFSGAGSVGAKASGGVGGGLAGGTLVFQVGDEILGELTDRALADQGAIYGQRRVVHSGSQR